MPKPRQLRGVWLGRRDYESVHALQLELSEARKRDEVPDTVLFVEHNPVITLGRGAHAENLTARASDLDARGVQVVRTGRGGDITLHAPGQLVCYPILDLSPDRKDVRRYVNDLTRCMQLLAERFGVGGGSHRAYVGLWVDRANIGTWPGDEAAIDPVKLGAIGVRISRWVTMHGFAFNLSTDLDLFHWIVPCGISEFGVASLEMLTGSAPPVDVAAELALKDLARVMDASLPQDSFSAWSGELSIAAVRR